MKKQEMEQLFISKYGESAEPLRIFNAPGRVNLIGEHIDYNGGYVFPAALEFGTTLALRKRADRKVSFASMNLPYAAELDLDQLGKEKSGEWIDYPVGIILELEKLGARLSGGYDLLFQGEIPNGSGLSSSASLEVVTAYALLSMEGKETDTVEIARLSQRVENGYVGVNSGIMDQFAVANGAKDHAILLMCDTLEYKLVPFRTGAYKLIISNTKKRRGLVDSKYNERRSQCDAALEILRKREPGLEYLAHLQPEQLNEWRGDFPDEVLFNRAKHVVEENARVLKSVDALTANDLKAFGELMNASHDSLRDLYEVSCLELDVMVEEARKIEGTLGARMTGAGFGGCTVSLVHEDAVDRFLAEVGKAYLERTGIEGEFYVCGVGDGVHEMKGEN
ncbi:MAG: galactokinase [Paenibacillus macerans]|uniref:Galactokinase n=1 Tax=Paenibacillus macerans TaxID=44252 RepID=A0A090ZKW4_PAEMA|nr:galactokinase [Paenibacillus macerans]KFN11262.1 galactokinase [Paenibacillus macerans]MBS5911315.1 galactokinase [Paenibacillus macerans]MCY7561527.1 galactokinase [Paenibacillus macerans]MDU7474655.1 galactokinase [Paenibacillus macerans]MEC0140329.1 galactokinase [Paenibacillus macerans]